MRNFHDFRLKLLLILSLSNPSYRNPDFQELMDEEEEDFKNGEPKTDYGILSSPGSKLTRRGHDVQAWTFFGVPFTEFF